jgi:hypothetical protein
MMTHFERFEKWSDNRSPAECALQSLALEYESRHFRDLRLEDRQIEKSLLEYEWQDDVGRWHRTCRCLDSEGIDSWILRFRRHADWLGLCEPKFRRISIRPGLDDAQRRITLLHEMIHAYESILTVPFREWLVLELHRRLVKKISERRLRRFEAASTNAMVHNGAHGVLFLLKSLDLDLRFGWQPGTVFGYGRADLLVPRVAANGQR